MLLFSALLLAAAVEIHKPSRIPLHFEPNRGQVAGETEWIATARGGTLFITGQAVAFATADPGTKPRIMRFVGAREAVKGEGEGLTGGYSNYFHGREEKNWRSGIPHYSRVRYRDLYPGIDLIYYSTPAGQIEYDLEIAPGADPGQIELLFGGFDSVSIGEAGDLLLRAGGQLIVNGRPKVRQGPLHIPCTYALRGSHRVHLHVAEYDRSMPLTIDPVLDFSTYLGGPGEDGLRGVAVDRSGFIYATGYTQTPATPSLNPFQQPNTVVGAAFVAKFTPNADRLLLFSVLSSSGSSSSNSLQVDAAGNMILVGSTYSPDFPTRNAFQKEYRAFVETGFISKIAPDGRTLVYSSYFGGSGRESISNAVVDSAGALVFSGSTASSDIPLKNAYRSRKGGDWDCFIAKVDAAGVLAFSTFFGGEGTDYGGLALALDGGGRIYIGGETFSDDFPLENAIQSIRSPRNGFPTAFLSRLSADGQKVDYSTFLGGLGSGGISSIAFNSVGEIYLAGRAYGGQFATRNAFQPTCEPDVCTLMMKLDPSGQQILNSSFLTGAGRSSGRAVAVASDGSVYVAGTTASSDFPSRNSLAPFVEGGQFNQNLFAARFSPDLRTLAYSTFLGGTGDEQFGGISLDAQDRLLVVGWTPASDLQVKSAFQPSLGGGRDGFLARISDPAPVSVSPFVATPGQIAFRYVQGGSPIAPAAVQLAGEPQGFKATANAAWVTVNPQEGTAPTTLRVGAAMLSPGSYAANVTLTPASGLPLVIPVSLTVLTPAPVFTSIEPAFVPIGSDDTIVTIHGSGFTRETRIRLYETIYDVPLTLVDPSTLQFKMSYLSFVGEGSYKFSLVNPGSDISQALILSAGRLTPSIVNVVHAASRLPGPEARGGLLLVSGLSFGPVEKLKVTIGDFATAVLSNSGAGQVTVVVPSLAQGTQAAVVVTSDTLVSTPYVIELAESAPGLFTADDTGTGDGLIDGTPSPGSTITLFGTGDGGLPMSVWIDGKQAVVESSGLVESKPGWFQVRVVIPADASVEGPVAVVVKAGDRESQPGVTLSLR